MSSASATWRSIFASAASSISGPTVTPSVKPLPAFSPSKRSSMVATNCSAMPRCTSMRLGQMHACPVLRNFTAAAPLAACTGSASSNTMNGACPPSSMLTRFTPAAACCGDELADLGGAGEGDLAHERVRDQLGADGLGLRGGDQVDDARGQPDVVEAP